MRRIRVLIVDDSVVIRRVLREVLASDAEIEVAGVAANGQIALAMIEQVNPDLITLDIEMPVMDGLQTLQGLKERYSKIPVIMFSTLTQRGALATLDALALGARDYVTKPEGNTVASSIEKDSPRSYSQGQSALQLPARSGREGEADSKVCAADLAFPTHHCQGSGGGSCNRHVHRRARTRWRK